MSAATSIRIKPGGHVARLRSLATREWDTAVGHRFVDELFAGTLDDSVLARYLIQDYQFFALGMSQMGACVAFADKVAARLRFAKQLGFLANSENTYFETSFIELRVGTEDKEHPTLTSPTKAFQEQMLETVQGKWYPDLLAMICVAEWLYLDWAERVSTLPKRFVHHEWIRLHRGEDFRSWVQFLVDELERVFPDDTADAARIEARFKRAVKLERAFFDAAFE